jgi:transposase InsO family protein
VQGISEGFLLPVLELVMAQFAFVIEGFHSDNGSEYINHKVAKMLTSLRIEQTKSHSRQSNDNALAESKNASVARKHMGYAHIPKKARTAHQYFLPETLQSVAQFAPPLHVPNQQGQPKRQGRKGLQT